MAATSGFITRVYGEVQGSIPFQDANGATAFSRVIPFASSQIMNFPSSSPLITPLPNGFRMPNGAYVYSVISMQPAGLNVHGLQLVTDTSAATLATNRG